MQKKLFFQDDGSFKLLQLTDIHFTQDDEADHRTVRLMRELIRAEQPDFIMTTGDTVYGERNLEYIEKALEPVAESGIPWGFVFGNHDVEFASNRTALFERVTQLPGCASWHDLASADGMGNCFWELCDQSGKAEWLLFGVDSGGYNPNQAVGGYGYVTDAQIKWYRKTIASYEQKEAPFSAMVFMHIALPEHLEVWNYEVCYGTKREGVGCSRVNSGFFNAMLEAGHTKGVFVGHDHVNDYWGRLYGVALGYGRCTGFGTYGAQDFLRGGRVFRFTKGQVDAFDTYVRLEHGIVVDEPWVQRPRKTRDEA
jgi:3',5'-cyclic AMP phosphodiesterase CpdA